MATAFSENLALRNWPELEFDLDQRGYAVLTDLLTPGDCRQAIAMYDNAGAFRKTITMQNHAYGQGEYRYFSRPLPDLVQDLRQTIFPPLAKVANRWAEELGLEERFPADLQGFLKICHSAGQQRPTPLLLKYGPDDFNRLHQDTYGEVHFPLQVAILLSRPGEDFEGGEFLLSEQRPRTQSKAEVVPLRQGDGVIFAGNQRPGRSRKTTEGNLRFHRLTHRHGVSRVRSGQRFCLGIIFHDAA